jgi:hypothetical protein
VHPPPCFQAYNLGELAANTYSPPPATTTTQRHLIRPCFSLRYACFGCCFQAYNDDELASNTTIKEEDAKRLGFNFWEKRTMTNDFATVVHRMKSLGEFGCCSRAQNEALG